MNEQMDEWMNVVTQLLLELLIVANNLTKVKQAQKENLFSFQSLKTTFIGLVIAPVMCA